MLDKDTSITFDEKCKAEIHEMGKDTNLKRKALDLALDASNYNYVYHFSWMGRPVIQYPDDLQAMQELIWRVKPDLIIETGIAHGGSLIFSASMLALLDMCDAVELNTMINPRESRRKVLGIDIDIRAHNREAIESHPMFSRIQMIEGSSIDPKVVDQVRQIAKNYSNILVCLDSNHTHAHVLAELEAYASLTSSGSYCVVFDTVIEDMPEHSFPDRPWGPGDNPKTAVREYLKMHPEFETDHEIQGKLLITVAPDGFLKRL
jgi:cephalosporin hydroxylase